MKNKFVSTTLATLATAVVTGAAGAAQINVSADITTDTVWTANNTYNLTQQIYVVNGATLTIQPGTVIASTETANGSGAIAITRGCKIIADGTLENPIIFTSNSDVATWDPLPAHPTGKNPKTGVWRAEANEWGNLTILGRAFVSNNCADNPNFGNASALTCNVNNLALMEGLTAAFPGDLRPFYGGNADNDDSGILRYVSLRYGGRVIGLGNELNGLSLGGVGRGTTMEYVEIMNNVDDGIEIWGGTVNLKYVNIWNIGDDSFDLDEGWRGKAQFVLIVQGYSAVASQGSGVGDNCLEIDGAETANTQPALTAAIYNLTVIGQPISGDKGVAYRDNARVQIRNAIFMDLGENLVHEEFADDCSANQGYGFGGTHTFAQTWTLPYTYAPDGLDVNPCNNPAARYTAQSAGSAAIGQGFLNEITDSVFFRNLAGNAYTLSNTVGVTAGGRGNPAKGNLVASYSAGTPDANMPIKKLTRGPAVVVSGLTQLPVISIDPRAANAALTSNAAAPADGFFTPAQYRGAFNATNNWICGWTAADAYGFVDGTSCVVPCPADTNGDGQVNVTDLLAVIGAWGSCP